MNESNHFVYKYVYKGEIIYIGKTDGPIENRIKQHGRRGDNIPPEYHSELRESEIYYFRTANNIMSDVIESELIRRYKPRLNKAKKTNWFGLDFPELKWEKFSFKVKSNKKPNKKTCLTPLEKLKTATQELEDFKNRIHILIDFAKTEEKQMLTRAVRDESEMKYYMNGVGCYVNGVIFYFLKTPIRGFRDTKTNQYYIQYYVPLLKKWLTNDLRDYEHELINAINELTVSGG